MSEKGCLLSKSFNTLSVSNKAESKDLFTQNHIKASIHITQDTEGAIMKDQKEIFKLREMGQTLPNQNTVGTPTRDNWIAFPPKSIIESISIILKKDNYIVNNDVNLIDLAYVLHICAGL